MAKLGEKLGNNPKDNLGIKKVSISKLPAAGIIHGSHAMMYGADKYGPYNWRGNAVIASIYVDAIMRHVMMWFDQREEQAEDSGVHHLGHILANCAILLDAMETGNLVDDRPSDGKAASILERLNAVVKQRAEAKYELARSVPDASGNSDPPEDAPNGYHEQPSHSTVPSRARTLVSEAGPTEGTWNTRIGCRFPYPTKSDTNWSK